MAEREQQLEELFHAALKRKPDERASFLSEACASDPDLRAQVESLISAHESPGSSFDTPAYETTASMLAEDEAGSHIGRTIGHYEILSLLGKGGMGAVYLAKDARLDRKVALKLLPLQFTANEVRLRRFIREARAASSLNHPNIITIYEIGQDGPAHYIATEYIEGETLRERIARAPIEASEAIDVAAQIAYALAAAHSAGIVHRDIKPENVMARPDGIIKVLDFGLAKLTEQQASNSQRPTRVSTEPGVVLGTVTYMSPEQARGLEVDARTDIWSLGVVIYEMIAGRAPFSGDTTADVIAAILKSEPQPIAELAPETPIALQKIIGRVLSKDRKERYQTSDEMLAELRAVKKETEFAAKLDRSDAQATRSFVPATGRLFSPRPALALLLAAAIIAGIWWAYRRQPEAERPSPRPLVDLHSWKSERGETTLNARLSHDGKMFAYTSARGRWLSIWVKQTQTEAYPVPVTRDNTNNWWPVWSPDDQQLAFISDRGGQNGIWTMPVLGGTPRLLKNIEGPSPDLIHWSRDGNRLYYQWRTNLYSLDVVSGVITQLTDFDPFKIVPFKSFAVSPDENHIAYNDLKDGQVDIWIAPMREGRPVQVTNDPEEDMFPLWHPDGKRIIYTSDHAGRQEVFVASLDGGKPFQITSGGSDRRAVAVSADGERLLLASTRDDAEIYGVETDTGREFDVPQDIGWKIWPEVSPDGQMIAFHSSSNFEKLWKSSLIGRSTRAGASQIQFASEGFNLSWSPAGDKLAFFRLAGGDINIFTVNASGGAEKQLTTRGIFFRGYQYLPTNRYVREYSWSPDGGRIAYCSRPTGTVNVWTVNTDGLDDVQITSNDDKNLILYGPVWSPDGKLIAYVSETRPPGPDGKRVWSVRLAGKGSSEAIFQADKFARIAGWVDSGNELIVAVNEEDSEYPDYPQNPTVFGISPGGEHRVIVSLSSTYIATIQLSPDGRTLAFVSNRDGADNIWLVPVAGGEARRITLNADPRLYLASPAWSPDGKAIYYSKQKRWNVISMIDGFN